MRSKDKNLASSFKSFSQAIRRVVILVGVLALFMAKGIWATEVEKPSKASGGFIDFNAYYDVEKYSTLTINAGAALPHHLSYFGFVNFDSDTGSGDVTESYNYYTEQNLTWSPPIGLPLGFNIQWNLRSGLHNDRLRFAPQWRVSDTSFLKELFAKLHINYGINFHIAQIDDDNDFNWQMEHFYRVDVFPDRFGDRVYLSGFADHSFGGPGEPNVVMEHQLGIRVIDNWYVVAEYRRNEYRPRGKEDSLGLGLECLVHF